MKCYTKIITAVFLLLSAATYVNAQILYEVAIQEDGMSYEVSLHSLSTINSPFNTTTDALVSIRVPIAGFMVGDVESVHGSWALVASELSPDENPEFDYYSFTLLSETNEIEYEESKEDVLFRFRNDGFCTGFVELLEADDPLNELSNFGNFLSIEDSENQWTGNFDSNTACTNSGGAEMGCTDPDACNYDVGAFNDDGSCIYSSGGDCEDPCSDNIVLGCTNPAAENFNADATCDDGSCFGGCICEAIDEPVCGEDGVNYANACEAVCAGVGYTEGDCPLEPTEGFIDVGCGIMLEIIPGACGAGVCEASILVHFDETMVDSVNQWLFIMYDNQQFEGEPYELNATLYPPQSFLQLCDGAFGFTVEGLAGDIDGCFGEAIMNIVCDESLEPVGEGEGEDDGCGITVGVEYDCMAQCPGALTLAGPEDLFDGVNQWLVEVFAGPVPEGEPIKLNATLFPNETIDGLCDGEFSALITGLNGDVEGCVQEITGIMIENECTNPPCADDVVICDPMEVCTPAGTAIIICPETCEGPNYNTIVVNTIYPGSAQFLENGCIEYTPLPLQEGQETIELVVQDASEICYRVEVTVQIDGCPPICEQSSGTLETLHPEVCQGEVAQALTLEDPVVPNGFLLVYLWVNSTGTIADFDIAPNFQANEEGEFSIHPLVFSPQDFDLSDISNVAELSEFVADEFICASLTVEGAPSFTVASCIPPCEAAAGTLTCSDGSQEMNACSDDVISAVTEVYPVIPEDFILAYLLAEGDEILEINVAAAFELGEVENTSFSIYPLIYDPLQIDPNDYSTLSELLEVLAQEEICGDLGIIAPPTYVVNEDLCCPADAGSAQVNAVTHCNNQPLEILTDEEPNVPEGFIFTYLLIEDGAILQASLTPEFDLSAAATVSVHTLVYDPATINLTEIDLLEELEEAFANGICGSVSASTDAPQVEITICNLRPFAVNDTVTSFEESIAIFVLDNDYDPDGDSIEICGEEGASNGTIFNAGDHFIYVRDEGYDGDDQFKYTICDPEGLDDEADVFIDVKKICPPAMMEEGCLAPLTFHQFCPDWCVFEEDEEFEIVDIAPMFECGVTVVGNCVRYISIPGFTGSEEMYVTACNNDGLCETVTVMFTVTDCNDDGPTPASDNATSDDCETIMIDVLANDTDPQGDDLFLCEGSISDPAGGTASVLEQQILFIPDPGFSGVTVIYYDLCDSSGDEAGGVVFVQVDCPQANPETDEEDDAVAKEPEILDTQIGGLNIGDMHPLPASDYLTVDLEETPEEAITVRVYDITGKVVFVMEEVLLDAETLQLPTRKLQTGTYILQITCDEQACSRRFVKE